MPRRFATLLLLGCMSLGTALSLVGCASRPSTTQTQASGGMGSGMGGAGGEAMGAMAGAIASAEDATFTLGPVASSAAGVSVVSVVAPADGWLVVRSASPEGAVLGSAWVPKGQSTDVVVKLTAADTADVIVALHVDKGVGKAFEYDPARPDYSLDKPIVAGGAPVQVRVPLSAFGAETPANSALILVEDQPVANEAITVRYLLLPAQSWLSVNAVDRRGLVGRQVGLVGRPSGESQQVAVPVSGATPGDYVVTVHVDRGQPGVFEYDPANPLGGADQPYKSAGVVVSKRISIR